MRQGWAEIDKAQEKTRNQYPHGSEKLGAIRGETRSSVRALNPSCDDQEDPEGFTVVITKRDKQAMRKHKTTQ